MSNTNELYINELKIEIIKYAKKLIYMPNQFLTIDYLKIYLDSEYYNKVHESIYYSINYDYLKETDLNLSFDLEYIIECDNIYVFWAFKRNCTYYSIKLPFSKRINVTKLY